MNLFFTYHIIKERKELILRLIHELPPKQKQVFTLRKIEGLEVSEVEAITEMSADRIFGQQIKYGLNKPGQSITANTSLREGICQTAKIKPM